MTLQPISMASLSPDAKQTLLDAVRGGIDLASAAQYAGLNATTVYRWMELGQREEERLDKGGEPTNEGLACLELWRTMRKARAEAVVRNVAQIQKAANQGEWKAAAWWLERTMPDSYGKER